MRTLGSDIGWPRITWVVLSRANRRKHLGNARFSRWPRAQVRARARRGSSWNS